MNQYEKNIEKEIKKLEIINQWISNCDTKSSFLLTFYGVLLTVIMTSKVLEDIKQTFRMDMITQDLEYRHVQNFFSLIFLLAFIIISILSLYYIYNTLRARTNTIFKNEEGLIENSSIFFMSIDKKKYLEYELITNRECDEEYLKQINSQVFINSKIATLKFINYNKSILYTFIGFSLFIIYVFIN